MIHVLYLMTYFKSAPMFPVPTLQRSNPPSVGELVVFASVDCATLALAEDAASLEIPFSPSEVR